MPGSTHTSHAKRKDRLAEHIELLRCHYNFTRPHRALKFGSELLTPAMQAGLTNRRLTFRDIFSWTPIPIRLTMFVMGECCPGGFGRAA